MKGRKGLGRQKQQITLGQGTGRMLAPLTIRGKNQEEGLLGNNNTNYSNSNKQHLLQLTKPFHIPYLVLT